MIPARKREHGQGIKPFLLLTCLLLALVTLAMTGVAQTYPHPPLSNHLRIVTWNLEFFNKPNCSPH